MSFSDELKDKLIEYGCSLVGFSNVEEKLPKDLKYLKYAITIGIRLSDSIVNQIEDKPTFTYFHHYRTINAFIDNVTLKALLYIQSKG